MLCSNKRKKYVLLVINFQFIFFSLLLSIFLHLFVANRTACYLSLAKKSRSTISYNTTATAATFYVFPYDLNVDARQIQNSALIDSESIIMLFSIRVALLASIHLNLFSFFSLSIQEICEVGVFRGDDDVYYLLHII